MYKLPGQEELLFYMLYTTAAVLSLIASQARRHLFRGQEGIRDVEVPGQQAGDGVRRVRHPSREGVRGEDRGLEQDLFPDEVLHALTGSSYLFYLQSLQPAHLLSSPRNRFSTR